MKFIEQAKLLDKRIAEIQVIYGWTPEIELAKDAIRLAKSCLMEREALAVAIRDLLAQPDDGITPDCPQCGRPDLIECARLDCPNG